jgi:hypothetical protein
MIESPDGPAELTQRAGAQCAIDVLQNNSGLIVAALIDERALIDRTSSTASSCAGCTGAIRCPTAADHARANPRSCWRGSAYRSGKSFDWIKSKDPKSPAKQREETEDWQ